MKSVRFSILGGIVVAVSLALVFILVDYMTRARIERKAHSTLTQVTLPLMEAGDPTLVFGQLDDGVSLESPSMSFLTQYLPLVALDPWEGSVNVPSLFANATPNAELFTRAHYSRGTADIKASLSYRNSEWRIRQFVVIPGPAAQ